MLKEKPVSGTLINTSINEVLSRDFALSLAIGVVVGTYSSTFVASPIIYIRPEKHHRSKESRRLPA